MVFSVGLEYFFNPEPKPVLEIVRKKDRLRFPDSPDARKVAYYFESLDFPVPNRALNSYLAEFEPIEDRASPAPRTPRHRIAVRSVRQAGTARRRRQTRAFGRRFHLLRFHRAAWLPQNRGQAHNGARGDAGTARVKAVCRGGAGAFACQDRKYAVTHRCYTPPDRMETCPATQPSISAVTRSAWKPPRSFRGSPPASSPRIAKSPDWAKACSAPARSAKKP